MRILNKNSLILFFFVISMLFAVSGCNQSSAPALVATPLTPVPDAIGVSVHSTITVRFSADLDQTTISKQGALAVYKSADHSFVESGSVGYKDQVATFTDVYQFEYGTKYDVVLSSDITSLDGASLGSQIAWSFTTEATPPPPPPQPARLLKLTQSAFTATGTKFESTASALLENVNYNDDVYVIPVQVSQDQPVVMGYSVQKQTSGLPPAGTSAMSTSLALNKPIADVLPSVQATLASKALSSSILSKTRLSHLHRMSEAWSQMHAVRVADSTGGIQPQNVNPSLPQPFGKCLGPYVVGQTQCTFVVYDYNNQPSQRPTTLMYASPKGGAYWFVDNADLNQFDDKKFQTLDNLLVGKLIPNDTHYFGGVPDSDHNGKIMIVFSDILMDPAGSGGAIGYVAPWDQQPDGTYPSLSSNEGDIFYAVTPLRAAANGIPENDYFNKMMPATMVHELKHMIAVAARLGTPQGLEDMSFEEPSAVAAEQLAGYGTTMGTIQPYAKNAFANLETFRLYYPQGVQTYDEAYALYGYGFLFFWKVAETIGHEKFWKAWVHGPSKGIPNLEAVTKMKFSDMMMDWAVTLLLDHTGRSDTYNYQGLNLRDGSWAPLSTSDLYDNFDRTTRSVSFEKGTHYTRPFVEIDFDAYALSPAFWIVHLPN